MKFWDKIKGTDEDGMMERLKGHKDTTTACVEILKKNGIDVERTENNCSKGDFKYKGEREKVEEALDEYFKDDKITNKGEKNE